MTYISPRVAIWGAFCPPLYTVYNNSRSRKELRAARVCVYTAAVVDGAFYRSFSLPFASVRFPFAAPSFSSSSSSPLPPLRPFVSRSIARDVLRAFFRRSSPLFRLLLLFILLASRPERARARGAPSDVPGFLRCYRESFRVRLRATDYRNQAIPGSGISNANYNH